MNAVVKWLAAPLAGLLMTPVFSAELAVYDARYEVERGGSNYGEATRKLSQRDDGTYVLQNETEISFLFLSDVRRYDSTFTFVDGWIEPLTFRFKRSGTGSNKSMNVRFDSQNEQVLEAESGTPLPVDWHANLLDEASMLEQLRYDLQQSSNTDFSYRIVDDKGEYDEQRFRRGELEVLSLPFGTVEALKVSRVRKSSTRETHYWFAPELGYVMVKMEQLKEGDEVATLVLETLN
ncbi:DUF3108 domain-containing protein [Pseudidiomarina terrestris]|uniref:DUF3108 domain-containing protein n=1 Tax=Pseudidiomarina terrestris TaxID=2820060 RepID=A0AAW7QYL3_9GAMM|nr:MULTISPECIES: DUF3108 domain-containing protein [unclassified Pseudidiomarina]MDN7123948.1 DUF3108 domain-containing protein [Pseudidiomarina sp. 1APP75-32.1]MDN7127702.1 DUF3108 domain-containing protein [Pseudidiomarina sp. 1APR75-33.1]MDN7136371.1 DUF3108 domain-containing protein [Pseudidiomarina sp. 1ASP75-5]